ncbi:MAG: hypothetical protein HY718_14695 [Planctomycetes bacterium]|nr:hypothetical protein [Planctomycetota bacterium]
MRPRWLAITGLIVTAALLGLAVAVTWTTVSAEPETLIQFKPLKCSLCGHEYTAEIGNRPARCPKCRKEGVWPASRCDRCGTAVAMDIRRFNQEKREPYCPKCGGRKLADLPAGPPAGAATPE